MKSKSMKSWFFIVLLITVIAYLSIKPETFKTFNEGFDISNSYISKTDISNIYTSDDTYDKEKKKYKKEKEKAESSYSPYIEPETKVKDWFDFNTYTRGDFAFISIVFILFIIILFLLSKI
jgi:hypothetical protein|uniref:Glutathione S-transferase C-terminal domain-containing protein n=1 Tax=viral metagenome TaxID=1070528 RepID=A0A6C0D2A9_9ZZZZ